MNDDNARFAWWYYFWLMVAMGTIGVFISLITGSHSLEGLANWAFATVGLVGLWGYLRRRPVGPRLLWVAYFGLTIFIEAYGTTSVLQVDPELLVSLLVVWAVGFAITFPLLLALWRYAFRSPDIWRLDGGAA